MDPKIKFFIKNNITFLVHRMAYTVAAIIILNTLEIKKKRFTFNVGSNPPNKLFSILMSPANISSILKIRRNTLKMVEKEKILGSKFRAHCASLSRGVPYWC
jgi:hypothetical protein